jgi:hexokinase
MEEGTQGEPQLSPHDVPCTELIRWTKGFGAPNVEGHDVGAMFEKSLKKFVRTPRYAFALAG